MRGGEVEIVAGDIVWGGNQECGECFGVLIAGRTFESIISSLVELWVVEDELVMCCGFETQFVEFGRYAFRIEELNAVNV